MNQRSYCHKCGETVPSIDIHSDEWCDVLDTIKRLGDMKKGDLVEACHSDSGEGESKRELRCLSFGELLARAVSDIYGGGES